MTTRPEKEKPKNPPKIKVDKIEAQRLKNGLWLSTKGIPHYHQTTEAASVCEYSRRINGAEIESIFQEGVLSERKHIREIIKKAIQAEEKMYKAMGNRYYDAYLQSTSALNSVLELLRDVASTSEVETET